MKFSLLLIMILKLGLVTGQSGSTYTKLESLAKSSERYISKTIDTTLKIPYCEIVHGHCDTVIRKVNLAFDKGHKLIKVVASFEKKKEFTTFYFIQNNLFMAQYDYENGDIEIQYFPDYNAERCKDSELLKAVFDSISVLR